MSAQEVFRQPHAKDRVLLKAGWEIVAYVKLTPRHRASGSCRIVDYLLIDEPEAIAGLSPE